MSLKV